MKIRTENTTTIRTSFISLGIIITIFTSCSTSQNGAVKNPIVPKIDLSHWKITIPTANQNGKPIEVSPPTIHDYHNIEALKEFMYPDSTDGSIVFYAYPAASTANSKFSRSELREQMKPGDNDTNWKFSDGAYMKVTMAVPNVSISTTNNKKSNSKKSKTNNNEIKKTVNFDNTEKGEGHRVIIAQIHGKLSQEQQKLIGQKDTNAPPILKVYYQDGTIEVRTKKYIKQSSNLEEILVTKNWKDTKPHFFKQKVGNKKFTIEVIVSEARLEVVLNNEESVVYDDVNMQIWDMFYNYFKTGNYLNTRDKGAYSKVKIYDLEVSH